MGSMPTLPRLVITGLVLTLLLSACAAPNRPASSTGDQPQTQRTAAKKKVVAALRGDPPVLNAKLGRAGAGRVYGVQESEKLMHVGLLVRDDKGEFHPALAEAIPTVENGLWRVFPDGRMETTWKIRPGAAWHDGVPFTADDLVFTAMVVMDKALPEFGDIAFDSVEGVDAVDPRTVTVRWSKPFIWANGLFSDTTGLPHPKHLLERVYQEDKASYTQVPLWTEAYTGTGAFKMKDFVRSSHMILEANDKFVLGRPKLDEIEVKFLQDANAAAASLLAGVVDLTLVGGAILSLEQSVQVRDQGWNGKLLPLPRGSVGAFPQFINPSPQVILEPNFRRALLLAVDRQLLVDTLQAGLTEIAHTNFTPTQPEYKDIENALVKYPFDQRRATQLVEGLGYTKGQDGMFRDAAGQPLSVELRSTPGREVNEDTTFIVADHWKRIGVGVDVVVMPLQRNSDREYRQTRPGFEVVGQPDDIYRFHSREIPTPETRFVGDNRMRYANPMVDALVERYYVTIPRPERVQVLGQLLNHMTDNVIMLSFFYETAPVLVSNRLRNVTAEPSWNPNEWDIAS
jgi:peptide/nickel transport system substrate-binding protein